MSIASAIPGSGKASSRLSSIAGSNSIQTNWRMSSGRTNAKTSSRSRRETRRPPVRSVSSSITNRTLQRSTNSCPSRRRERGVDLRRAAAQMKNAKPVAVISAPLRLSGRRRQATRPQAANEPPTSAKTTWRPSIGSSRSNTAGRSASSSQSTAAIHRAAHGTCARRPAKRLSSRARARSGDAVTSPATCSHGTQRISIRRLSGPSGATDGPPRAGRPSLFGRRGGNAPISARAGRGRRRP